MLHKSLAALALAVLGGVVMSSICVARASHVPPASHANSAIHQSRPHLAGTPRRQVRRLLVRDRSRQSMPTWRHSPAWTTAGAAIRPGFHVPPVTERRYSSREVILDVAPTVTAEGFAALAREHRLTLLESVPIRLGGRTLHRLGVTDGRSVPDLIRALAGDVRVASAQPNYLYALQDDRGAHAAAPHREVPQYAADKLRLDEAHTLATGRQVLVAVIDTGIDGAHPYLRGAIAETIGVLGDSDRPGDHGTAMAGAIADHGELVGVAPRAKILAIRAFTQGSGSQAVADTIRVVKAIDLAVARGARVINMSFAGPDDPSLAARIAAAHREGVVMVAAAGNQGPGAPPQYPAAYPQVIAVTATDADDQVFEHASGGAHIAVAAPGVDVLAIIPGGGVSFVSGTSIAAAHVSGVAALLIERRPSLAPDDVRRILMTSAMKPSPPPRRDDIGAGRVDAYEALRALDLRATAGSPAADARVH